MEIVSAGLTAIRDDPLNYVIPKTNLSYEECCGFKDFYTSSIVFFFIFFPENISVVPLAE